LEDTGHGAPPPPTVKECTYRESGGTVAKDVLGVEEIMVMGVIMVMEVITVMEDTTVMEVIMVMGDTTAMEDMVDSDHGDLGVDHGVDHGGDKNLSQ